MARANRTRQKHSTASTALALLLVLLPPVGGVGAQQNAETQKSAGPSPGNYVLRSQTNVVLVDVRVRDKSGKPVADLTQDNFRVLEDGVPQTITSFSLEDVQKLAQAEASSGPPPVVDLAKLPPNVPPETVLRDRRLTVLFFDVSSMQPDDLIRALKSAQEFVEKKLTPADLVAVVTYTSSLRVLRDFTNDRDALSKAIKSILVGEESSNLAAAAATGEAGGTNAAGEEIVAQDVSAAFTPDETEFNIFNTDQKLAAVESLSRMLRALPGRKSVIHFSSGVERTGTDNQAQLRATIDAANQSNVSLYTMDARGLAALPPGGDASTASPSGTAIYTGAAHSSQLSSLHGSRETLASLSQDTGGRTFYDLNDLGEAFQQIQAENSSYYLLGYSPRNARSDGKFRRIRVEVDRPGVKVEARPGYFAPKDFRQFTREDKELQLEQALALDQAFLDLPFVVDTAYFRAPEKNYNVVLAAKIPGAAVSFLEKSARHETEFDFVWRVLDAKDKPAGYLRDTLPVKIGEETFKEVTRGNFLYEGSMVLPPGDYRLKVVVRENQTGKMGTFEQPLILPPITESGLTLSSVVLSNELKERVNQVNNVRRRVPPRNDTPLQVGTKTLLPSVTRVFRTSQSLYVLLESYRGKVTANAESANPAVALAFFRDGAKVAEAGPFQGKLEKGSGGKASYFVEVPLQKFPVGRYTMQVNVLDPDAARVAFSRVPMAIVKEPASTAPSGGQ
ncbi:MAG: VWA domain-containing protein [Terriglobia bacterium]